MGSPDSHAKLLILMIYLHSRGLVNIAEHLNAISEMTDSQSEEVLVHNVLRAALARLIHEGADRTT